MDMRTVKKASSSCCLLIVRTKRKMARKIPTTPPATGKIHARVINSAWSGKPKSRDVTEPGRSCGVWIVRTQFLLTPPGVA